MLFKIKEIGDEGLSLNLAVPGAWLSSQCPDLDAVLAPKGLHVRGRLVASGDDVLLRGTLRGALDTTCSRCLEKARVGIDVELLATFVARPEGEADDSDEDDDDPNVVRFDGEVVDLSNEIRDQLLLTYPIKPLCREDCAGLCAVCGGNRNQIPCDCQSRQPESRTPLAAVLGKLKMKI